MKERQDEALKHCWVVFPTWALEGEDEVAIWAQEAKKVTFILWFSHHQEAPGGFNSKLPVTVGVLSCTFPKSPTLPCDHQYSQETLVPKSCEGQQQHSRIQRKGKITLFWNWTFGNDYCNFCFVSGRFGRGRPYLKTMFISPLCHSLQDLISSHLQCIIIS